MKTRQEKKHKPESCDSSSKPEGWEVFVEDRRILNPIKIKLAYVFAANQKIRDALASLNSTLPWVKTKPGNPSKFEDKMSDENFVLLVDDAGIQFVDREKFMKNNPKGVIILLSSTPFIGCSPPGEAEKKYPYVKKADLIFYVDDDEFAPSNIIPSAIRCAEDKINIEESSMAKRFVFLVVDDEPRWFSQFLPTLYRIIGQRADIMTARTYDEAEAFIREHCDKIVCLISDINLPGKEGDVGPYGKDLVLFAEKKYPRFSFIIASKSEEAEALRDIALIMPKGDPGSIAELERYVRDFTGLGDFLFIKDGKTVGRASTLAELREEIARLPVDVLETYGKRDYFSTWLHMHGHEELGDFLRIRRESGEEMRDILLSSIDAELEKVTNLPFRFVNESGEVVETAYTPEELVEKIKTVESSVLELNSNEDGFSTWLMRKGYTKLADELRPLKGEGEELRGKCLAILGSALKTKY